MIFLKGFHSLAAFPHKLSSIVITVGGLALFLVVGSLLISHPITSAITRYVSKMNVDTMTPVDGSSLNGTNDFGNGNANANGTVIDKDSVDGSTSQAPPNTPISETEKILDPLDPVTPLSPNPTQVDSSPIKSNITSSPDSVDSPKPKVSDGIPIDDASPTTPTDNSPPPQKDGNNASPVSSGKLFVHISIQIYCFYFIM